MTTRLVTERVWPELTRAVRGNRYPCDVAVAYFGKGASRLLPLPAGSRLVVDASERAVSSGQTSPADLSRLMERRVRVFSVPNLHAKVYVLQRSAYIGSANVSRHSAGTLVEALMHTTDTRTVRAARKFVQGLCTYELGPKRVEQLGRLYHPPKLPGGLRGKRRKRTTADKPELPRVLLAQLEPETWSERDQTAHDKGYERAKRLRKHPRSHEVDSFRYTGKCPIRRRDVVVQITEEGRGKTFVTAPGNVLHVLPRRNGTRLTTFVYLECPALRRRQARSVAKALGRGAGRKLKRNGLIRDAAFARALLAYWSR